MSKESQRTVENDKRKDQPLLKQDSAPSWPLEALARFNGALVAADRIDEILQACVEITIPSDHMTVSILLLSGTPTTPILEIAAVWTAEGRESAFPVGMQFSAQDNLFRPLWNNDRPCLINDLAAYQQISAYLRSAFRQAEINAVAVVPLRSQKKTFGALLVSRSDEMPFSPQEVQAYRAVASMAQSAIHKLWLIQKKAQAFKRTQALYQISQRLLEAQSVDAVLQIVLESELFGAAGGTIALMEPPEASSNKAQQELVFRAAAGAAAENILGMRMPVTQGVVGWVVRENETALVPDAYADERFYRQIDQDIDFRTHSILCAPLRVDERVIGAIELVDVRPEALSDEGSRLLTQIADQAALLIENQRLLEETRRQARELSVLLEVSQDLTSTLGIGETLNLISSRILDLVKADGCHLFLLQPGLDGETILMPVSSSAPFAEQVLETPLKLGQGITGRVAQTGKGLIANRVDLDPRGFTVPGTPREPESLISVPLVSESRQIGVMTVSRLGQEGFVESDLQRVSAMASQAATVIEKARLLKEAQQRSQELGALNAVVSTASQSLSLEEILGATLDRITDVFPESAGLIALIDGTTGRLQLAEQRNLPQSLVQQYRHDGLDETLCAVTVSKGQAYVIPDLTLDNLLSIQMAGLDTDDLTQAGLYTYLGAPLVAQGRILGTVSVFGTQPNAFTQADSDLLTTVGQQVGIAVRNAQLFEQTEQSLEESTALYQTSEQIANTLELEDVLQITVDRMTEYAGADQCRIVLFDTTLGYGRVMAEYRPTPDIEKQQIPIDGNLAYEILRDRGEAVSIEDIKQHPITQRDGNIPIGEDVKSLLLVPLIVQGRLIGAVELEVTQSHRVFTPSEISFCRTLADRAALAMENRRLFSQTFYTLQETTLLYQASRTLTRAQNLDEALHAITDHLPVKQIDQCWIALVEANVADAHDTVDRSVQIVAMWDHEGDASLLERRFSELELPIIAASDGPKTWIVNDLKNETELDPRTAATLSRLGVKSALIVPLLVGERPLGWLLLLTHHHTHIFDAEQIRPYEALADQAAIVIRNQQLLQQVQESLDEVRTVHRQYLREEWSNFLASTHQDPTAYTYDGGVVRPAGSIPSPVVGKVLTQRGPVTYPATEQLQDETEFADQQKATSDTGTHEPGSRDGSGLVAPLTVRGEVIGALGLEDPQKTHTWTADELSMVQEIADRVALAVENARLLRETQASLAETERLYQITGRLADADSSSQVVQVLAEELRSALGPAYRGSILCTGPNPADRVDWLEASVQWNTTGIQAPSSIRFSLSEFPAFDQLLNQRQHVIVGPDYSASELRLPWTFFTDNKKSTVVVIPLVIGESRLGLINIIGQQNDVPDRKTLRFLESLSDRAAVALESVRLYRETQRRALQLEAAAKVSRAATSILEQEKLLSSVVELIHDHFDFYHAQVFLLDPTERWAILEASTGEIGQRLLQRGHSLAVGSNSLVGYVTSVGEPRIATDVAQDPIHFKNPDLPDTRAELAIPLRIGERVIGALDVQSTQPGAFGPDDVAVLSTLADQLAIAIENARLYQAQLETAAKLREVDRLKTQFLANMSHELRTPLNSIIGFSRVILKGIDGPVTDLQKQDLTAIYNSGQLLLRLINDILDLSKIEAGKMELSFEETDLGEMIKGVTSTTRALLKDKPRVELRYTIADDLPSVMADATRVRQVLLNLLSNAAKFTEKGRIELSATYDAQCVSIQVSDTGIGIPSDKFDVIFQEFEQVDGSTTRSAGGTGLGLPISRHFVEMHGGRMWVESQVGVGSTFTVELPIKGPQADEQDGQVHDSRSNRRAILAVDDDADVIRLYKRYLEKQNYQVIGLTEAERALEMARELQPYAILLDLLMPGKDGWSVLHDLKSDPQTQDVPIIMCSMVNAAGRGFSLGAADFLVKPITEDGLLAALERLDDQAGLNATESRRVLIIEDELTDQRLLRRILETASEQYQVLVASDGEEGIRKIQQMMPDLVVLDLMMPKMDGFAVIEWLKSDAKTRQIPLIVVTAKELTSDERGRINGRVAALFQKGLFKEEELLQDLNRALISVRTPEENESKR